MKIILTNFRCHSKKTIIIPENGLILIRGDNGKGKSTILKAIYYCLYGGGNKTYVKEGEKSMSVEIIDGETTIKRSRPPNHLVYKDSEGEYEGDEAQALVESFIGCNSLLFDVGCYIRQKHKFSSIITADLSDQSSVIEQISQKGNEEIIKEKLKEAIKHLEEQRRIYYTKKTLLSSSLSEKGNNDQLNRDPPEGFNPEEWTDEEVNQEYDRRKSLYFTELKRLEELRKKMLKANNEISEVLQLNLRLTIVTSSLKKIKSTEEDLEIIEDEIKRKEALAEYLEKKDQLKELEEKRKKKINELKKKLESLEPEEKVEKELNELMIQLNLFTEMKKREQKLQLDLEGISTKLSSNKILGRDKNIPKKLSQLKKYFFDNYTTPSLPLVCPCCDEEIYMSLHEEKLVKTIDQEGDTKKKKIAKFEYEKIRALLTTSEKISEELRVIDANNIHDQIEDLEKRIEEVSQISRKIQITKAQIEHSKRPTIEEEKIKLYLTKTVLDEEDEDTEYLVLLEDKKKIERELADKKQLEKELSVLEKKIASFGDKEKVLQELKDKIRSKEKKVERLKQDHSMFEDTLLYFKLWLLEKEKREKRMSDEKTLKKLEKKVLAIEERLPILESLLVKSSKAAVICLQETLDTINELAKSHLKELFEDEIEVTLSNVKEDKIKISIECSIRGVNITDFQEQLGGGEQQRIELAYCLALNELTGSKKVLMFDESFGALHPEIFMVCLRYLREKISLDRPILIVSHKEYEGIFDKVITL